MKTRLMVTIENYKRDQARIERKIKELKWSMKNAPSMTINGEERLKEYQNILQDIKHILTQLEWIARGEE